MSMTFLAVQILQRLLAHDFLSSTLRFTHVQRFLELTRRMWPEIVGQKQIVPDVLPVAPAGFLSAALVLPPKSLLCMQGKWPGFRMT